MVAPLHLDGGFRDATNARFLHVGNPASLSFSILGDNRSANSR